MEKREDGYNISEDGDWNVAADYSKRKIMLPLDNCDIYQRIARFGYDSFLDEVRNLGTPTDVLRLMGMDRLVNELLMLIENALFAMKVKDTEDQLKEFEKQLRRLLKLTPNLSSVKSNAIKKSKQTVINEKFFNGVLKEVTDIKYKINTPLNKNNLIFTHKSENDSDDRKKKVVDDVINKV